MNIAVFASGEGTNFENIVNACRSGYIPHSDVKILIATGANIGAVRRAKNLGVEYRVIEKKMDVQGLNRDIFEVIKYMNIEIICLAGFIYKITDPLLYFYKNRILNIHPSLLPQFGGRGMYGEFVLKKIIESKPEKSGVTVHIVDENLDGGPVIVQKEFYIPDGFSVEDLRRKCHEVERELYPYAIKLFALGKIFVFNNRVFILGGL